MGKQSERPSGTAHGKEMASSQDRNKGDESRGSRFLRYLKERVSAAVKSSRQIAAAIDRETRVFVRIALGAVIAASFAYAGFRLAWWLHDAHPDGRWHYYAQAGGGVVLITFLRGILEELPAVFAYVSRGELENLGKALGAVFVGALGLGLVMATPQDGTESSEASLMMALNAAGNPSGTLATFFFTFEEDASIEDVLNKSGPALALQGRDSITLRRLGEALAACAEPPHRVPRVRVVGAASSRDFDGVEPDSSRVLNTRAANLRAANVASALRRGDPNERLDIEPYEWRSYEEMIQARRLIDRPFGKYTDTLGILNRRVAVELLDPGACGLEGPWSRQQRADAPAPTVASGER